MQEYAIAAFLLNIWYFFLSAIAGFLILRLLDYLSGIDFYGAMIEMRNGNYALAIYYGLRFLGLSIWASAFIG